MNPWDLVDWNSPAGLAAAMLFVAVVVLAVIALRKRSMRRQTPGPLMFAEAWAPFRAGLSLVEKRELASRVRGQRVRWSCTLQEVYRVPGGGYTAMLRGGDAAQGVYGHLYFDPTRADRKRLESLRPGVPLVVEGTVRIDLQHDLLKLEAALVCPDGRPR